MANKGSSVTWDSFLISRPRSTERLSTEFTSSSGTADDDAANGSRPTRQAQTAKCVR